MEANEIITMSRELWLRKSSLGTYKMNWPRQSVKGLNVAEHANTFRMVLCAKQKQFLNVIMNKLSEN